MKQETNQSKTEGAESPQCEVCGGEAWIRDYDADNPDSNLWYPCWLCSNCRRPEVRA